MGLVLVACSGQSNMAMMNPLAAGGLIPTLATAYPSDEVLPAKRAWPGEPIARWNPSVPTSYYHQWLAKVLAVADGRVPRLAGICWAQGEADAKAGTTANDYRQAMVELIGELRSAMRERLGCQTVPVAIARLSDYGLTHPGWPTWADIRQAHEDLVGSLAPAALVDADDLNLGVHYFTIGGYRKLGERFAAALQSCW
jgi:hypothetical protein